MSLDIRSEEGSTFEQLLNEETSVQLVSSTKMIKPQIVVRVNNQNIKAQFVRANKEGVLFFKVNSGTVPGKFWEVRVQFSNLPEAVKKMNGKLSFTAKSVIKSMARGDIKVYCNGHWWRYACAYSAWKHGYGLYRETRPSRRWNPRNEKMVCKHVIAVCYLLPNISGQILREYRRHKVVSLFIDKIRNR